MGYSCGNVKEGRGQKMIRMKAIKPSFITAIFILAIVVQKISGNYYFLGRKGRTTCAGGDVITRSSLCKEACKELGISFKTKDMKTGKICYKDAKGKCYKDGFQGAGAFLICEKAQCDGLETSVDIKYKTGFVEYIPGHKSSNIILTAPHGGLMEEDSIPLRMDGCKGTKGKKGVSSDGCIYKHDKSCQDLKACKVATATDGNTIKILKLAADEIGRIMNGKRPHVIISNLRRSKLDPNREILEAAQGNTLAKKVYREFHSAINDAKKTVKTGLIFDFHGQQNQNAIQLGYLISKDPLNKGEFSVADTGFRALVKRKNLDKNKNFVLGNNSLGAFFEDAGYAAVPSNKNKKPGDYKYYRGGFITRCHGSRYDEKSEIDAVQLEFPKELRLGGKKKLEALGKATGEVIARFYKHWY